MNEFAQIFESVGLPVAACVVLFYVLFLIIKSGLKQNTDSIIYFKESNEKHLLFLQTQNERLTQIIADCTRALNDNTKAFNELIIVIKAFKEFYTEKS